MAKSHALSVRGKMVAVICLTLAIVAFIVSFAQALHGETAVLLAQVNDQQRKDQERSIQDQLRYTKDRLREINDVKKETKGNVDTSQAEGLVNQLNQCLQKMSPLVGSEDFWSDSKDCNDINGELETELQEHLRPIRNCSNNKRNVLDRAKERKNLDRQVKDILRNDKTADVSALNAALANIDAQLAKANGVQIATCNGDGADLLQDVQSELNTLFQDFYTLSNELNQSSNQRRQLEDGKKDFQNNIKKNCEKDKSREFKNYEKEFEKAKTKGIVSEEQQAAFDGVKATFTTLCVDLVGQMQAALDAGDSDAFNDTRNTYQNSERDFWDTLNEARGGFQEKQQQVQEEKQKIRETKNVMRDLEQKEREARRMKKDLVRFKKKYDRAVKKYADKTDRKELLAAMAGLITQAEGVVANVETLVANAKAAAPEDPQSYWLDYQQELNDLQNEFNEVQNNVNRIGGIFGELLNMDKEMKRLEREAARYAEDAPELNASLTELLNGAKATLAQIWTSLVTDPEGAEELFQNLKDLERDWYDTIRDYQEENGESNGDGF